MATSAAFDSSDLDPIKFAEDWQTVTIAGVKSPGVIAVNGIHGFERETKWDVKIGKGAGGGTNTVSSLPPAVGSIDFQLWLEQHFVAWKAFRAILKPNPAKGTSTAANALDIWHPTLASLNINSVVTHKISPERHVGNGRYIITVHFIEWLPPPPVSVAKTTSQATPDAPEKVPGKLPPSWRTRADQLLNSLRRANRTPVG